MKKKKSIVDEKLTAQMKKNDDLRNDIKKATKMMSKASYDKGLKEELEEAQKSNLVLNSSIAALTETNTKLTKEVDELKKGNSTLKKDLVSATKLMAAMQKKAQR